METQSDMFERLPARKSDPITSKLAAVEIIRSGTRAHQQAQTIAAVKAFPGRTSAEIADAASFDRYALARRAGECEALGSIRRGEIKTCSISGRKALTWWPV
jgi:hypothetical protein